MVHADTYCRMVLLADVQERNEFCLDLLQLSCIFLVGIFQMLERTTRIDIVAWINAYFLTVERCYISGMGRKMDICHQGRLITVGFQLSRDILHILCLTNALSRETHEFTTCINDSLGLGHTTLSVIRIYRTHRLDADGIRATNANRTDARFC